MKKILYIRGQKNYFLGVEKENKSHKIHNFANDFKLSWKKNIFNLWDATFKVPYLIFRQKLRELSIQNTKDINYFDLILYNDTEYEDFVSKKSREDFVIFTQDDDDFILPTIHEININSGLNIYIWLNLHYWKGQNRVKYTDFTPTKYEKQAKYHKVKSSHFCYRNDNKNTFNIAHLSDHRQVSKYAERNYEREECNITYHNTYFNLYIWHPSSLCFLNTLASHWQFIGPESPFSFEEQQEILKLNTERVRRLMKRVCKNEKNAVYINILKQLDTLYSELF